MVGVFPQRFDPSGTSGVQEKEFSQGKARWKDRSEKKGWRRRAVVGP